MLILCFDPSHSRATESHSRTHVLDRIPAKCLNMYLVFRVVQITKNKSEHIFVTQLLKIWKIIHECYFDLIGLNLDEFGILEWFITKNGGKAYSPSPLV